MTMSTSLKRCKEYLTTGRTIDELRQQELKMRAAGFRKRRNGFGQATTSTREFYQWWDRKTVAQMAPSRQRQIRLRAEHRCIICGETAAGSNRSADGYSQWCESHRAAWTVYLRRYYKDHKSLQPTA